MSCASLPAVLHLLTCSVAETGYSEQQLAHPCHCPIRLLIPSVGKPSAAGYATRGTPIHSIPQPTPNNHHQWYTIVCQEAPNPAFEVQPGACLSDCKACVQHTKGQDDTPQAVDKPPLELIGSTPARTGPSMSSEGSGLEQSGMRVSACGSNDTCSVSSSQCVHAGVHLGSTRLYTEMECCLQKVLGHAEPAKVGNDIISISCSNIIRTQGITMAQVVVDAALKFSWL